MTNFDLVPNRRNSSNSLKWTKYPNDVLPMWVADMDFPAPKPILSALQKQVEHGVLGYESPSRSLYEIIAARMYKLYNWNVDADMFIVTSGVNSGYNVAARTFYATRRGYLIQTPVYNEFHETQKKTGVPQVEAQLAQKIEGNRIRYEVDFDAFAKAAQNSSIFLLCNPHNPIGHIYSRAELKRMAEICIENDVVIVSDEIHSELLLGTAKFTPMATLSREIANRTITLIAASKTFNIPGLHCAFAIIPNRKLRERYQATAFKMGMEVASPGLVAARVAFSGKCDSWLRDLRHYLTNNRDFIVDYVTEYMPSIRATIPDATYLAWLDITQTGIKDSPHEFFLKNGKVALSNGANFGKGGEGHVRLNFGTSRKLLEQGLERMRKALRSI